MQTVTRTHEISCGHRVYGHESKCANLHGHNYVFEFVCEGELDKLGRVIDFSAIKTILCDWLEANWDHKLLLWHEDPLVDDLDAAGCLFCTVPFNPTAENMAEFMVKHLGPILFHQQGVSLIKCRVWETSKCSASYEVNHDSSRKYRANSSE